MTTPAYGQLPPESDVWHFPARVERVVDGDTIDMTFDLGMRIHASRQRVRLYGVDTAETYGVDMESEEYARGQEQAEFVADWLLDAEEQLPDAEFPLRCYTLKAAGKYGRWLVDILDSEDESLVGALFDEYGSAIAYE